MSLLARAQSPRVCWGRQVGKTRVRIGPCRPGYFAVRIENTPPALRPNYARQLELDAFGSAEALRTHLWWVHRLNCLREIA